MSATHSAEFKPFKLIVCSNSSFNHAADEENWKIQTLPLARIKKVGFTGHFRSRGRFAEPKMSHVSRHSPDYEDRRVYLARTRKRSSES